MRLLPGKMTDARISSLLCFLLALQWNGICVAYVYVPKINQRTINPILAKEGDINIGYLTDITTYDDDTQICGPDLASTGCMGVEMAIYVMQEINGRADLLPNISLGFVILDGCSIDIKSLEVVSYFIKENDACSKSGNEYLNNTSLSNRKQEFTEELKNYDVIGIVGPQTSTVAETVAVVMGVFELSMIGIRPTSDDLSDKSRYEYFMRLVAPDSRLVLAMIRIVKYYGWKYVSVVYSDGAYGENAYTQILNIIDGEDTSYGICIAVAIKVSTYPQQEEYDTVTDTLISNGNAKVIITFLEGTDVPQALFATMLTKRELGTFIWLGADSMVNYETVPSMKNMLEGIIFVDHPSVVMPDFESYVEAITPLQSQGNTWILDFWEDQFNCTFDPSSVNVQKCSKNLNLDSTVCPLTPSLYNRIHDAFLIYAQAAHDHITAECPDGFANKALLKTCNWGDPFLQRILNTTFQGVLGEITFDQDGNFAENLVVKQYYRPTVSSPPTTKIVGFWNNTEMRLYMNESEVSWKLFNKNVTSQSVVSKPPISICSQPCFSNQYTLVKPSQICCWTCMSCRNNEIIVDNSTQCRQCQLFTWPDDATARSCLPIAPIYLDTSNIISVALLCLASILILFAVICASVFLANRQNKLLQKLNIKLNILIVLGILVACVTVILLMVRPDASRWICTIRYAGFHVGINLIYSPLLVKNVLICRFYFYRKRNLLQGPRYVSPESQMVFFSTLLLFQLILVIVSEIVAKSETTLMMPSIFEEYVEMYCNKSAVWFLLPLAYNIIIMLLCAGIGFITRKLSDNFNESWFIFLSVATTLFAWIVFVPVYFTISNMYLQPAILGFALILNALVTLICQYLPIIYALVFVMDNTAQAVFVTPNPIAINSVTPDVQG